MKEFVWGVIREALLTKSDRALRDAAELAAKYVPLTVDTIFAFLEACRDVVIRLGDAWIGTLVAKAMAYTGLCGDAGQSAEPVVPAEVAQYEATFMALALAA